MGMYSETCNSANSVLSQMQSLKKSTVDRGIKYQILKPHLTTLYCEDHTKNKRRKRESICCFNFAVFVSLNSK